MLMFLKNQRSQKMRTKSEVVKFLNSQVGKSVNAKSKPYQGQCVSLVKALFEYLGVPDPYKARGNAKDAGDTYLREGIAKKGSGWLNLAVRRTGGWGYGHIWVDVKGVANYEQNGAKALKTTKNTRPISHAHQIINLDKYVKPDPKPKKKTNEQVAKEVVQGKWGNGVERKRRLVRAGYNYSVIQGIVNRLVGGGGGSKTYTVQPGDYLILIGRKTRKDWRAIARLNNIRAPYIIHPGQKIKLP